MRFAMRLYKSDLVLHVLQLFMHSMAQEKPVLKITKRVLQQVFCWGFFCFWLEIFFHCLISFTTYIVLSSYILVYLAQYIFFFTTKLCKIDYQANNFNTSNRRIALWIGMEALCALIQGHCLIMLTCPLAYFDIGISAVSEQKYKKKFNSFIKFFGVR